MTETTPTLGDILREQTRRYRRRRLLRVSLWCLAGGMAWWLLVALVVSVLRIL